MKVRLVAKTEPINVDAKNGQEFISFIARVSNPSNQNNFDTAPKLLKYLIKNLHWSPFEHVFMTVEIETSRAIAQQILRHRSFTFQEFSQRYAQALEFEKYEARSQDTKNRQNSIDDCSDFDKDWFNSIQDYHWKLAYEDYEEALKRGIAKEQARMILPLNTATKLYMTGPIRSWIHYIDLRGGNGTQKEHRDIALECKRIFFEEYPDIAEAMWPEPELITITHLDRIDQSELSQLKSKFGILKAIVKGLRIAARQMKLYDLSDYITTTMNTWKIDLDEED